MSLTGQLATGELGRWCAATLTGTSRLAADVATPAATAAGPVRPSRVEHPDHWAVIGGAHGQRRLAFATQHAPPYYALLGAHRAGLTDWAGSRGADARLARVCVVLTDWESAYRTGRLPAHLAPLYADPDTTVPDLLAAVPAHQVAELVEWPRRWGRWQWDGRPLPVHMRRPLSPPGVWQRHDPGRIGGIG